MDQHHVGELYSLTSSQIKGGSQKNSEVGINLVRKGMISFKELTHIIICKVPDALKVFLVQAIVCINTWQDFMQKIDSKSLVAYPHPTSNQI